MTTQFEIGKKYASQYNSGVITIIKRTAKFVTFTEEINGQSMKSMIINGNGEISEGKTIENRKSIKVLNDSEYLSNGICSYYATNEVMEEVIETEEIVSNNQEKNNEEIIDFEQYEQETVKFSSDISVKEYNDAVMLSPTNLSSQIKELRQQLKIDLEYLMASDLTNKKARKDSLIKDYENQINLLIIESRNFNQNIIIEKQLI